MPAATLLSKLEQPTQPMCFRLDEPIKPQPNQKRKIYKPVNTADLHVRQLDSRSRAALNDSDDHGIRADIARILCFI